MRFPLSRQTFAATESGSGELRTWLPVAAALDAARPGIKAALVDYFVARKSTVGNGWVTWPLLVPALSLSS